MKPALTILIIMSGALLIRYAFLGRNPWDDVLTVVRGQPSTPVPVLPSATGKVVGTPEADR